MDEIQIFAVCSNTVKQQDQGKYFLYGFLYVTGEDLLKLYGIKMSEVTDKRMTTTKSKFLR